MFYNTNSVANTPNLQPQEAYQLIEAEQLEWNNNKKDPKYYHNFLQAFHQAHPPKVSELLQRTIYKFENDKKEPGVAIDLGCGYGASSIYLLKKGWKVISVDSSEDILAIFKQKAELENKEWLRNGQLQLVCESIENYQFPSNVQVILAQDTLSYCNPGKIQGILDRAHSSLAEGGYLTGNFFTEKGIEQDSIKKLKSFLGIWIMQSATLHSILRDKKFEMEYFNYVAELNSLDFITKKESV